jgi:hypothetical protein
VKTATASLACISLVVALLVVRGPSDWSRSFAVAWYGLFGLAVLLGLSGLALAAGARNINRPTRLRAVAFSLPALLAAAFFFLVVLPAVGHLD